MKRSCFLMTISLFILLPWMNSQAQLALQKTPPDQEGPFYPVDRQLDRDNNLLQVTGRKEQADGDILHLRGMVRNTAGTPLDNVTVEIWQTDPRGRYLHPRDPAKGPRNKNFQYRGMDTTGEDGRYSFTTLVPGEYGTRPPHIHFKVWREGELLLTSQIYFSNHPDVPAGKFRTTELQTVELTRVEPNVYHADFQIVL